ncbi:MAG: hypothetical protein JSS82_14070 [Bacteroidetes bacterium]|nr:hypothetical protein [Bacteroidota bacterium]
MEETSATVQVILPGDIYYAEADTSKSSVPKIIDRLQSTLNHRKSDKSWNEFSSGNDKKDYNDLVRTGYEPVYIHKSVGFALVVSGFWAATMFVGMFYGMIVDGWETYMSYFTNWMWSFGAVFYTIYVLGFLNPSGYIHHLLILGVFWPYFANVMAVLFLAPIMLLEDSSMITDAAKDYSMGVVHLVEWGKHSLPAVVLFIWIVCVKENITSEMNKLRYDTDEDMDLFWFYVLLNFIACNALAVGYSINNDFHHVYHMKLNTWVAIIVVEFIYVAFLVVPIILSSPISDPYSKNPRTTIYDAMGYDVMTNISYDDDDV